MSSAGKYKQPSFVKQWLNIKKKLFVSKPVQLVLLIRRAGRPLVFITWPFFSSISVKADISAFEPTDSVLWKQNFLSMDYTNTGDQHRRKYYA